MIIQGGCPITLNEAEVNVQIAKVSLDRVNEFVHQVLVVSIYNLHLLNISFQTELIDKYDKELNGEEEQFIVPSAEVDPDVIGMREAAFTWSKDNDGTVTPGRSRRNFVLRVDEEVTFKKGAINLIVGPTGSGKTSMLMALLGTPNLSRIY